MSARVEVRQLRDGEAVPDLLAEFAGLRIQPAYTWLAEANGKIVGALLGGHMHGILVLLRLIVDKPAPTQTSLLLIRAALRAARERGLPHVMTLIAPEREEERKLGKLFERHKGAAFVPFNGVIAIASIERK